MRAPEDIAGKFAPSQPPEAPPAAPDRQVGALSEPSRHLLGPVTAPALAIEDSPLDAEMLRRTLRKVQVGCPLRVIAHGLDACTWLESLQRPEAAGELPRLIFLDLHLPGISGWELLDKMRCTPLLAPVPIVVMTTSLDDDARVEALGRAQLHHASKPVSVELLRVLLSTAPGRPEG